MNLKEWLQRSHPPVEQLKILEGVCAALHEAHTRGALRGGVSPENIQIESDSQCSIQPGGPVPPGYRAPEERTTPTTDIFSAGVILYEILTGKNPFGGLPPGSAQPTPLKSIRRDVPGELSDAIMACLESDPDWRPKDLSYVLQVVQRLRSAAGETPSVAAAPAARAAKTVRKPARTIVSAPSPRFDHVRKPRRRGGSSFLAIVMGALVLVGVGFWLWQKNELGKPRPTPTTTTAGAQLPTPPPVSATPEQRTPAPTPAIADVVRSPTPFENVATPMVIQTPLPTPLPILTPLPTPRPMLTPLPTRQVVITPAPTPEATPPPPPSEPATLKALAPRTMTRGQSAALFDVHGAGIRADHRLVFLKGREVVSSIVVVQKKLVNSNLLRVLLNVSADIAPGSYSLMLVDSAGIASNTINFEVPK